MDPLTHTLVGANLGATRLREKTGLATAAAVIGANLPDVDAILYFAGPYQDFALGFRRGWTHGALALVLLPLIQTALLIAYARWKNIAIHRGWLLGISTFAILTHPTLDWLNNYGMRWLMPFRGTWFYGDSVYIMDPWLWLILGCGWLAARRPTGCLIAAFVFVLVWLTAMVAWRSPQYLVVVAVVAVILLTTLVWKSKRELAMPALLVATAFIVARLVLHHMTVLEVRREIPDARQLMVAPHPISPFRWEVLAQIGDEYRHGEYAWRTRALTFEAERLPVAKPSAEWTIAQRDPGIRGFMTWARYPWYEVDRTATETRVRVYDARYMPRRGSGFGAAVVVIPAEKSHEIPTTTIR